MAQNINLAGGVGPIPSFGVSTSPSVRGVPGVGYDPRFGGGTVNIPGQGAGYQPPAAWTQNLDGVGEQGKSGLFGNLLNVLGGAFQNAGAMGSTALSAAGGSPMASRLARYGPGALQAAGIGMQDGVGAGIGAGAAAFGLGKLTQNLAKNIKDPRMRIAAELAGGVTSTLAIPLGGQLGKMTQQGIGQLAGGTQSAVTDAVGAYAASQREEGKSGLTGRDVGLAGMSKGEEDARYRIAYQNGVNIPLAQLNAFYDPLNRYKNADMNRQMQLNQQLAQLTGALNRQTASYQLGSQAMQQGGAITSQILASNPYQASVLNTGAVRGI